GEPCTRNPPFLPSNAQQRRQKHPKKEQCTGHTLYHRTTLGKIAITMRDPPPPSPSPLGTAEAIPAGQPGARLPRILRGGGPPAKRAQGGGLGGDEAPWQMHAFGEAPWHVAACGGRGGPEAQAGPRAVWRTTSSRLFRIGVALRGGRRMCGEEEEGEGEGEEEEGRL
ncbi:unnamed protein product, partial [Prorocentrum cordatum]